MRKNLLLAAMIAALAFAGVACSDDDTVEDEGTGTELDGTTDGTDVDVEADAGAEGEADAGAEGEATTDDAAAEGDAATTDEATE